MPDPYEAFQRAFGASPAKPGSVAVDPSVFPAPIPGLRELFEAYGGASVGGGLYRVHSPGNLVKWNRIVGEAFPKHQGRVFCFGYDWLGRHFALDAARRENGRPLVLMLEPGTGEALRIPVDLATFHNEEITRYRDEALAAGFFERWIGSGGARPLPEQGVGYRVPLFLGGTDTVDNLELIDLEIYWGICGQLLNRTRTLPPGSTIKAISRP
jgi:hypothetical protein